MIKMTKTLTFNLNNFGCHLWMCFFGVSFSTISKESLQWKFLNRHLHLLVQSQQWKHQCNVTMK